MTLDTGSQSRWTLTAFTIAALLMTHVVLAQDSVPQPPSQVAARGLFPEPHFIVRAIDVATRTVGDGSGDKSGLYPEFSMVTGAGWVSIGPGYRQWFGGDRVVADASAALSSRSYKMVRGHIEVTNLAHSRVAIGSEIKWHDFTQNTYFGQGPDSLESDRSEYRVKSLNTIGYANVRPMKWLTIGGRAGWLRSPSLLEPGGRYCCDHPSTREVFPGETAFSRVDQPDYLHGELSVTADTRDHRSHPRSGGLYRGAWTRFSDRDGGTFSFQRFEAEGAHFVSTNDSLVTVAMHGWLVGSDTAAGHEIPFYLMPSLGGSNTLRAFADYRFHDRHFAVATVELRLALLAHIDGVMFADAGSVAARMADLNFDKRSIGAGVRLHTGRSTLARMDVATGQEGWRLIFSYSDPLHLRRVSQRTAPIPFVP